MVDAPTRELGYAKTSPRLNGWWALTDEESTPELQWPQSVSVYQQMRREDPQIQSVLRAVTLPIRRTQWSVDGSGCRDDVTRLVADDLGLPVKGQESERPLRTRDRFLWADHLRLSLLSLVFGHSFFEQVYRIDESGRARLRKLAWRPPTTIAEVKVADDGGLEWIRQQESPKIPVDRLVAYIHDREGGNWLGQSIIRPAYKPWLLKDRALRVQSLSLDRNGLGIPTFTAPPTPENLSMDQQIKLAEDYLATGLDLVEQLRAGEEAGAALPHGASLSLMGVSGKLPDLDGPIRYHDEQIARAVLAHFLNLGTETGSWALGSTFADFFTLSLQTVALQISEVTNAHVIEDLVDLNFGSSEPAPRLVFEEIGSQAPATADAIKTLIDCGAIHADEPLETFLRNRHGLPAAASGVAVASIAQEGL